jgi:plasmid stabilization system protein ParE
MTVRFHPAARIELGEARNWYEKRSPVSAVAFAQEVARAIAQIAEAPNRYPSAEHGTRRFVLRRFPFNIFYRADARAIVIVAVAHQKRRPGYWSSR